MGSLPPDAKLPWIETPLVRSPELSRAAGCNVLLKLENLQPSGSFKSRGIGNYILRAAAASPSPRARFYIASGGNAGFAAAHAAAALGLACTVVLPLTAPALTLDKLRLLGAAVEQAGPDWAASDRHMRENLLANDPDGVYVPPFDHQHVWDGAATMVPEMARQARAAALGVARIDAVVASVGGGGLLNGLCQGVDEVTRDSSSSGSTPVVPWDGAKPPTIVAVETRGADSLNASIAAGEHVTLPGITSIATSLGATRVSARTYEWARSKNARAAAADSEAAAGPAAMESVLVSDAEAAMACVRFADDARLVVEPACGATVSLAYNGGLRARLGRGMSDEEWRGVNVVLVVCGGLNVTLKTLEAWREKYASEVDFA